MRFLYKKNRLLFNMCVRRFGILSIFLIAKFSNTYRYRIIELDVKFRVFVKLENSLKSCIPVFSGAAGPARAWRGPARHGEGGGGGGSSEDKKEENQQQTRGDQVKRQEVSRKEEDNVCRGLKSGLFFKREVAAAAAD